MSDQQQKPDPLPEMPRSLKYLWGVVMTALLAASMLVEQGSLWRPLINCSIGCMQRQGPPTESK